MNRIVTHCIARLATAEAKALMLWNMSLALDQLGEHTQAIQHAEQALTIFDQIEDPNAAKVRAKLAAWREQTDT